MTRQAIPIESVSAAVASLVDEDVTITYRVVARKVGLAPSSLTRSDERRKVIDGGVERQRGLRQWRERSNKQSQTKLLATLAAQEHEIERLQNRIAVLQASHKAVILAIGEFGGMNAWRRFFDGYEQALLELPTPD